MSGSVNKVTLVGRLGKDPEIRPMNSGGSVANLSLATSERWRDQNQEMQERTEWHRVVMFGKLADVAGQYLKKGSQIYVEGRLQTRKWQDQDGNDRYSTEVVVSGYGGQMVMLGDGGNRSGGGYNRGNDGRDFASSVTPTGSAAGVDNFADDDIPF